mmetsp:Transcript_11717/g.53013  ORF Transcript_11717/g.53013 Transcript_11717/m.53013 type:complete len:933 (+) Transcript_11717:161-2959(+)
MPTTNWNVSCQRCDEPMLFSQMPWRLKYWHLNLQCPAREQTSGAVTNSIQASSQCDSTTDLNARYGINYVGDEFYPEQRDLSYETTNNEDATAAADDDDGECNNVEERDELYEKLRTLDSNTSFTEEEMQRLSSELYPSDDELEQTAASLHPVVTSTAAEARERAVVFPDVSDDKKLIAQEYALYRLRFKLKHKQTDAAFNKETKFLRTFAGGANVPSYEMCKKIVKMEDPMDYTIHFCPQYHRCWKQIKQAEWPNHENDVCGHIMRDGSTCGQRRFLNRRDAKNRLVPTKYFYYFGVKKAIQEWFATIDFPRLRSRLDARSKDDIWGGKRVKEMNEKLGRKLLCDEILEELKDVDPEFRLRRRCILDMGCDGIQVFKNRVWGVGLMVIRPFGIPAYCRGQGRFTKLIGIIPGPKEGVDNMPPTFKHCEAYRKVFMVPFVEEMKELSQQGILVKDLYVSQMLNKDFEYRMFYDLATCTGDTPARGKIACTYTQAGLRGDQYSYFSACSVGNKRKYMGYSEAQEQPANTSMFGADINKLTAFDPRVYAGPKGRIHPSRAREEGTEGTEGFNHAKALELHRLVEDKLLSPEKAGRYGLPPLAQVPHFDLCWGYALPVVHALLWGVCKKFWLALIDEDSKNRNTDHYMPKKLRDEIQARAAFVKCPHDTGRPYLDIVKYKKTWKMENWLHFAETYCLAFHDILADWNPWIFKAWFHLRCAIMHCLSSYGWYENFTPERFHHVSFKAQEHLREFAKLCQINKLEDVLTLNLRLISAHLAESEQYLGPLRNVHEFPLERAVQAPSMYFLARTYYPRKILPSYVRTKVPSNERMNEGTLLLLLLAIALGKWAPLRPSDPAWKPRVPGRCGDRVDGPVAGLLPTWKFTNVTTKSQVLEAVSVTKMHGARTTRTQPPKDRLALLFVCFTLFIYYLYIPSS